MTAETENLMLEILKRIQTDITDIKDDILGLKTRVSALDEHMVGVVISLGGLNTRMDKFDERLARVERRLDLVNTK